MPTSFGIQSGIQNQEIIIQVTDTIIFIVELMAEAVASAWASSWACTRKAVLFDSAEVIGRQPQLPQRPATEAETVSLPQETRKSQRGSAFSPSPQPL